MGKLWERFVAWASARPGRSIGTVLGFLAGILLVSIGFWKTLAIVLLTALGYSIGKWTDDEGRSIREYLEEKLPGRPDFH